MAPYRPGKPSHTFGKPGEGGPGPDLKAVAMLEARSAERPWHRILTLTGKSSRSTHPAFGQSRGRFHGVAHAGKG